MVRVEELRGLSMFGGLAEETLAEVAGTASVLRRPQGALIFQLGDPAPGLFIVRSGRVKVLRESPTGREQVLHVAGPGDHFNLVPVFDGGPCPAATQAISDVELILLDGRRLREVAARHPALALAFLAEAGGRLRHLVRLVDDLALHTVQGRLASLLLAQAAAAERGESPAPLTQAEMAARLGTVREMVGRTLKTFEQLGLIEVSRGTISVVDRAGLEHQADL